MRLGASYDVAPATSAPAGVRSSTLTLSAWRASSKVAVGATPTATPVAPGAGVRAVTVGLTVSVSAKTTSTQ